jgi:peptide/nickel transport system substrate-binding protein
MKKLASFAIAGLLMMSAACRSTGPGKTGTANPPFEGEPPQDAYRYEGETGSYGGALVLELWNDIRTLNVVRATDQNSTYLLWSHLHRCLIDYHNQPADYDKGLCTGWDTSPDAKQWTFHIRRGVRWSDGEPFTADDVLFSYDVLRDRNLDSSAGDIFAEGADENGNRIFPDLEKLDDYTVRFNLHHPHSMFLDAVLNMWLIPKHKWEQVWRAGRFGDTMKVSDNPSDVVGLGPFRLKEYVPGERAVLERNPYFWKVDKNGNRLPYLDRMVFVIAKDFNTVQAKFEAGEIDMMSRVRGEEFALVKRLEGPDVTVKDVGVSLDTYWLAFNMNTGSDPKTHKPLIEPWKLQLFRNQKFRQAVSYAVDREGLANTVFAGRALPIYSFVTPSDVWYADDIMKYPYDKDRAKQMLAEIGLKDANNDGILEDSQGHTVEVNLTTNAENSARVSTLSFVSKNLQDVGIKANPNPVPFNQMIDMIQARYNFEGLVFGWGAGVPSGPPNAKNILLSSGFNHVSFPNQRTPSTEWEARVDELLQLIERSLDRGEQKRLFAEAQRIWSEQLPEINLIAQLEGVAYRNKFGNLKPSSIAPRLTWNSEEIFVKQ